MGNGEVNEIKGRGGGVAWPMDPYKILIQCKYEPEVYKSIYRAQITYLLQCLEAERVMYTTILDEIKGK
jgi:hypothetical protein